MKNLTLTFLFLICFFSITYSQNWGTNFENVQKSAIEGDKHILLVFSGSDWCIPCMKLEKEIWMSDVFKKFSEENLVLYKADFPRKKKNKLPKNRQETNNQLAEQYNLNGYFPLIVIMDQDGKVKGELGYEKISPEEYSKKIATILNK